MAPKRAERPNSFFIRADLLSLLPVQLQAILPSRHQRYPSWDFVFTVVRARPVASQFLLVVILQNVRELTVCLRVFVGFHPILVVNMCAKNLSSCTVLSHRFLDTGSPTISGSCFALFVFKPGSFVARIFFPFSSFQYYYRKKDRQRAWPRERTDICALE